MFDAIDTHLLADSRGQPAATLQSFSSTERLQPDTQNFLQLFKKMDPDSNRCHHSVTFNY